MYVGVRNPIWKKSSLAFLDNIFTFKHQITGLCVQLFEIGLAEHKRRETEMNLFFSSQTEVITDYQHKTAEILADIEKQHEKVSDEDNL